MLLGFGLILVILAIIEKNFDNEGLHKFYNLEYRNYQKKKRNGNPFESLSNCNYRLQMGTSHVNSNPRPNQFRCEASNITIREAREIDLIQVISLLTQLNTDSNININFKKAATIWQRISSYPFFKVYIAVANEQIIGAFELLIMDNLAHSGMPSGIVEDVVVAKEHQRKGVGKVMMLYAMNICREYGCYKVSLSSNLKREDAHRFYESLGFEKHGYSFYVSL